MDPSPSTKELSVNSNGYGIWGYNPRPFRTEISQFGSKATSFNYFNASSQSYKSISDPTQLLQPGIGYILNMNTPATYYLLNLPFQASSYGVKYVSMDSTGEANNAAAKISTYGYNAMPYSSSPAASDSFFRMKSDHIFYFTGHGGTGGGSINFAEPPVDGKIITGSQGTYKVSDYSSTDLVDLVLVVLNACYSAKSNPASNNLKDAFFGKGVDTVVAFTGDLNSVRSAEWSNMFWTGLSTKSVNDYRTVDESRKYAIESMGAVKGGYDLSDTYGNKDLRVYPSVQGAR